MHKAFSWGLAALAATQAQTDHVTEEAFLAALNPEHAAVRALGAELARAVAARRRAGTLGNPSLEFWREQPDANPRLTNWTVAWSPPLDGRFGLGKRAADAAVAGAHAELTVDEATLRRELRRVFADWSLAHERSAVLAHRLERFSELALKERQRAAVGLESGLAARRLGLAEAQASSVLKEAEADLDQAEAEARAWHTSLPGEATPVLSDLPRPPEELDGAASPHVRSAEHRLEQARLEQRLSGRFWGFPTLQFGLQRLEDAGLVRSGPIFAASWSLPLFQRDQAERVEARRRTEIAAARLTQTRDLTEARLRGGLAAYRSLFEAVREASEASAETDRVIEAATAAYRAGEATLTDLLDALRSAFDTRLRGLELRARALAAHRELEAAAGRPLLTGGER